MHREHDLLDMILALRAAGCLSCGLHGWQQQRDQHADDGDHDQQFYKGKRQPKADRTGSRMRHFALPIAYAGKGNSDHSRAPANLSW
jgi:hypothetical protein